MKAENLAIELKITFTHEEASKLLAFLEESVLIKSFASEEIAFEVEAAGRLLEKTLEEYLDAVRG